MQSSPAQRTKRSTRQAQGQASPFSPTAARLIEQVQAEARAAPGERAMSPLTRDQLLTVGRFIIVIACAIALAFLLTCLGPLLDRYNAWRTAQRAQQAQAQAAQSERAYIAWVQGECGNEAWWLPNAEGALACVNKHGRKTGHVLVGAQP